MFTLNHRARDLGSTHLSTALILITLALCLALPQAALGAGWTTINSPMTGRSLHTATLLPNGRVLVAGGIGGSYLTSAQLFDPATGTWTTTGSLKKARYRHTATLLPNGKVLVTGGYNSTDGHLTSVELYDPATGEWTATSDPGGPEGLTAAREQHTATLLSIGPDAGKVLVVGGFNYTVGTVSTSELYNPATGQWTVTGETDGPAALNSGRWGHTATLLADGKVLVAGGDLGSATYTNNCELYDPTLRTWTTTGQIGGPGGLNTGRYSHTATLLADGKVLVAGGIGPLGDPPVNTYLTSGELYDPATKAWSFTTDSLTTARAFHAATLLPNGQVLVMGGYKFVSFVSTYLNSCELYNPSNGQWTSTEETGGPGALGKARDSHSATLLANGCVLVVGGYNSTDGYVNKAEFFDYAVRSWANAPNNLSPARQGHTATLLPNGQVLVAGGDDGATNDSAKLYNPDGSWSPTGSLTEGRRGHTATLLPDGKVLVTSGRYGSTYRTSAEIYDRDGNDGLGSWTLHADVIIPGRVNHTATLLANGQVLVAGGDSGSGSLPSAFLYEPSTDHWDSTGSLASDGRYAHTATLLPNGLVLVAGGYRSGADFGFKSSAELYNPIAGTWSPTGILETSRGYHTATLLPNGKVLAVGGFNGPSALASAELYDPATGTWDNTSPPGSLTYKRRFHKAILLPNGKVLVTGGFDTSFLSKTEIYDPASRLWTSAGDCLPGRYYHSMTLLPNGKVMMAGGYNSSSLPDVNLFDQGLGFQETPSSWRPEITSLTTSPNPSYLSPDSNLSLTSTGTGTGFRGLSEASGGATNNSSTGYPLVQLRRLDNEQTIWVPPSSTGSFSDISFTSADFQWFPTGHCLVTVFTNGIPSVSKFTLFDNGGDPTAVDLASFEAVPYPDQIVLEWETRTEIDNYGFYLWRADAGKNNYERITGLIPALGSATQGYFYIYADTDVTAGQSYSYKLEDVSVSGKSTFHGPITATAGYLNLLAPADGAQVSTGTPAEFRWEAMPFDRFRLQFCVTDDFSGQVVELPLVVKGKTAWLERTSYTPTDREWSAVKALVGRKGGWLCWRVVGTSGTVSSYTTPARSFRLETISKGKKQ